MLELLAEVTDLVLPRRCVGCSSPGSALCRLCVGPGDPFEVGCADGLEVRAAAAYDDGVRRAVIAYKERGRRDLTAPLAALLAAAVRAVGGGPGVVLVAPPSARAVAAARGGDHMQRLARRAARDVGARPAPGVLHATRAVRDSAGLSIAARERNLHRSLLAHPPAGRAAVLVDDVVTTGATLREAHRALRVGGWTVLGAAVVSATPRRFPASPLAAPSGSV